MNDESPFEQDRMDIPLKIYKSNSKRSLSQFRMSDLVTDLTLPEYSLFGLCYQACIAAWSLSVPANAKPSVSPHYKYPPGSATEDRALVHRVEKEYLYTV